MNRAYQKSSFNSDIGLINAATLRIENCLRSKREGAGLSKNEVRSLLQVFDILSFQEDWSRIVDLASRAVVIGVGVNAELRLYRAWIEGLKHNHDVGNLQVLAKHLLAKRYESEDFVALSSLACSYSGRNQYSKVLARHLSRAKRHSFYAIEACAVEKCESLSKQERASGLRLFDALVSRCDWYFSLLNFYSYALENESFHTASNLLQRMSSLFPACTEPHWVAARVAMEQEEWFVAMTSLEAILQINPLSEEAVLAYSSCLESAGDLMAATEFLERHAQLFSQQDFDFNIACGNVKKRIFARYNAPESRREAIAHYGRALAATKKLKMSSAFIHLELHDLHAGVGEERIASRGNASNQQNYWLLSIDDNCARGLFNQESALIRSPQGVSQNDVVFVARHSSRGDQVECLYKVSSAVVPDSQLGQVVRIDKPKFFESAITVEPSTEMQQAFDSSGCQNFSEFYYARVFKLDIETASKLVKQAETQNQNIGPLRGRHAV